MFKNKLPKAVLFLGLTSLMNDVASEIISPILPIFLKEVLGVSTVFIGVYVGLAESVASITKIFSGYYSDKTGKRERYVFAGYLISNLSRPFTGFITAPWHALVLKSAERIGKGIRNAPRDAWLGALATVKNRGQVFGFHKMMDNLGGAIGPVIATVLLIYFPSNYRLLFLFTIIPGSLSLLFVYLAAKAKTKEHVVEAKNKTLLPRLKDFIQMPKTFLYYIAILFLFTIANSSDAFIILKLKEEGVELKWIPLIWGANTFIKALASPLGGWISDHYGRKIPIVIGWSVYAISYFIFGHSTVVLISLIAFMFYGLFDGITEGNERALIVDLIPKEKLGTAFGIFYLVTGLCALPSSIIAGYLWHTYGSSSMFIFGSSLSLFCVLLISQLKIQKQTV